MICAKPRYLRLLMFRTRLSSISSSSHHPVINQSIIHVMKNIALKVPSKTRNGSARKAGSLFSRVIGPRGPFSLLTPQDLLLTVKAYTILSMRSKELLMKAEGVANGDADDITRLHAEIERLDALNNEIVNEWNRRGLK
jgi:hypothetical protein